MFFHLLKCKDKHKVLRQCTNVHSIVGDYLNCKCESMFCSDTLSLATYYKHEDI